MILICRCQIQKYEEEEGGQCCHWFSEHEGPESCPVICKLFIHFLCLLSISFDVFLYDCTLYILICRCQIQKCEEEEGGQCCYWFSEHEGPESCPVICKLFIHFLCLLSISFDVFLYDCTLYIFEILPVAIFIIEYIYMNIFMCTLGCQNKKQFTPCTILNTQSQNPGPATGCMLCRTSGHASRNTCLQQSLAAQTLARLDLQIPRKNRSLRSTIITYKHTIGINKKQSPNRSNRSKQ
jgi:hypothetical protein